jgi:hypothetical protein
MNIIESLVQMTTDLSNFRQVDSRLLLIVNLILSAVIPSVRGVGTIDYLNFTLENNIEHIFWGLYSFVFSLVIRWLWAEIIKYYKLYKRNKANGKKSN